MKIRRLAILREPEPRREIMELRHIQRTVKWTPILGPRLKIESRVFSGKLLEPTRFRLPRKNHDKEATIIHTIF